MTLVAGIDLGTQSTKLVVYDPSEHSVVAKASAPLEMASDDAGRCEQLTEWWLDAVRSCFAQVDPRFRTRIAAIAVAGQQHGLVMVDAAGEVLAPVKLWCDSTASAECAEIMQAVGGVTSCIELTGNPILHGYTAPKLRWTHKHRPQAYARLSKVLLPHDYLNFYLTGEFFCEYGDASGTGWLDVRTRTWSVELLRAIDPDRDLTECLPPVADFGSAVDILPGIADELGVPRTAVVSAGGGDNMMAALGTGVVKPGRLAMSLGTSGTLFAYADAPAVDASGAWAAFCSSSGGWLPLICTMNCTVVTDTVARMFDFSTRDGDALVDATAPGAEGLTFLPFLTGERTPDLPLGRGVLAGLTPRNASKPTLYRAAMEGATYGLKYGYDAFLRAGMHFDSLVVTGGGANSAAWRQMAADIFNLPVAVPGYPESAAFGAALQALWSMHASRDEAAAGLAELAIEHASTDPALSAVPDPGRVASYDQPYQRFIKHLDAVRPMYSV